MNQRINDLTTSTVSADAAGLDIYPAANPQDALATPALVVAAALQYVGAGLSIIPISEEGTKAPDAARLARVFDRASRSYRTSWLTSQVRLPRRDEVEGWLTVSGAFGIAVVAGIVSGERPGCGLEVIDFDSLDLFPTWSAEVERQVPGLLGRLPQVQSPRPGRHIYLRSADHGGSVKLAGVPILASAFSPAGRKTTIEVKGEGGYCIVPPSPGSCHPSGECYQLVPGSPPLTAIPVITAGERAVLLDVARSLDQCGDHERVAPVPRLHEAALPTGAASRPGDDFNVRGDWADILPSHGWRLVRAEGQVQHWCRPGKHDGTSATTGFCQGADGSDLLHVFSSNAAPFTEEKSYSKFHAYALLEHGGDFTAAARELRRQGFGGIASNNNVTPTGENHP